MQQSPSIDSTPIVQAIDLSKQVQSPSGELNLLKKINFSLNSGDTLAIVGASGSGKSTLLGLLAGLDQPSHGCIKLFNQDITPLSEDELAVIRAHSIGFVFQDFQLLPSMNALENVMLPLELHQHDTPKKTALNWLKRVGLESRIYHTPLQLSGGEQQRVAIARAFSTQPKLLLADEPTGNLDQVTSQYIQDLLFELNHENGTTLILVTHDISLANRCNRQLRLDQGELVNAVS